MKNQYEWDEFWQKVKCYAMGFLIVIPIVAIGVFLTKIIVESDLPLWIKFALLSH